MNSSAHDCAEMNSDSLAVHTLRSKTQYTHNFRYRPRNQLFLAAFWEVYRLFVDRKVIPHDCRRRLESFSVTEEDFIQLVIKNELTDGQFIELLDNKVIFDEYTKPPHGEIIGEVIEQIGIQDRAGGRLLMSGTGNRITLSILSLRVDITLTAGQSDKAPDGHWRIHPGRIPPQFSNSFPINPVDGKIAPGLVFEVAVSNETMPTLTQRDLDRYFAAGTGTRLWLAVKVFLDDRNNPPTHRWWAGWAARNRGPNGNFLNSATIHPESMAIVTNHNALLSAATNPPMIFHLDVAILLDPMPIPIGYPNTLDINMEEIRRVASAIL